MRRLMTSTTLVAALVFSVAAIAASSPRPPAAASMVRGRPPAHDVAKSQEVSAAKRKTCANTWLNQKPHVGSHGSFMEACIAKG